MGDTMQKKEVTIFFFFFTTKCSLNGVILNRQKIKWFLFKKKKSKRVYFCRDRPLYALLISLSFVYFNNYFIPSSSVFVFVSSPAAVESSAAIMSSFCSDSIHESKALLHWIKEETSWIRLQLSMKC